MLKKYKLDFAVPDLPAFKALGTDPSNLLRPSNNEEFGVAASKFLNGNSVIIPSSFALELNPLLVFGRNSLSLKDYQRLKVINTSRISIGTYTDSNSLNNLSIGYRTSLINKGDPRTDAAYLDGVFEIMKSRESLKKRFLIEYNKLSPEEREAISKKEYIANRLKEEEVFLDKQIDDYTKKYLDKNWNATKLDFAFAWVGNSSDSLVKNVKYSSINTWLTLALPVFKDKGQLLFGLNYRNYLSEGMDFSAGSLSSRLYFGSNKFKGFVECQGDYLSQTEQFNFMGNMGAELNLYQGIWVDFSAGITKDFKTNTSKFVNQLSFKYALTE